MRDCLSPRENISLIYDLWGFMIRLLHAKLNTEINGQLETDLQNRKARRDLKRFLVQSPAQSWVKTEFRPGCSGLYAVKSWKLPRVETTQPVPTLHYPHSDFPLPISKKQEPLISIYGHCLILPLCTSVQSLVPSSWWHPRRYEKAAVRCSSPKPSLSQAEQSQVPQPLLTGGELQPQTTLVALCWTRSSSIDLSCTGGPQPGHSIPGGI